MSKNLLKAGASSILALALIFPSLAMAEKVYLSITLKIDPANRATAGAVYAKYKQPFLTMIEGAKSKELLVRDDDVQVLHSFQTKQQAENYLKSDMFNKDVVTELKPLLKANPDVRIYSVSE